MSFKSLVLASGIFFATSAIADSTNVYTAADALALKRVTQVAVSPSSNQVAFNVMQIVATKSGKQWEAVNFLKQKNGNVIQLTEHNQLSFFPTWSPSDKYLAYITAHGAKQSIYLYDTDKHKATELFKFDRGIAALKWSPDAKHIAFVAADKKPTPQSKLKNPATDYSNFRLYIINIDENKTINSAKPVTSENHSISFATSYPWLDGGFDWSPDSNTIAFAYQPRIGENDTLKTKIAILNLKNNVIKNLPYTEDHTGGQPRYSFDGKWIAFKTNAPHSDFATALNNNYQIAGRICVADTTTFATHCLANTFNENPTILGWKQNNQEIFVIDSYKTTGQQIYALSLVANTPAKLISQSNQGLIDVISLNSHSDVLGFSYETIAQPVEPYTSKLEPFKPENVTHIQTPNKKPLGNVKTISWKSSDGLEIEGILITPPNYDPHKKYPLLLAIHGGPEGVWTQHYVGGCESGGSSTLVPCWGSLASQGFVVFQPNPRGSSGYGSKFLTANYADWGGHDYQDIMSGIDYLIQQGIADPKHLALSGWSYGGYMASWIVTQTNRFKVAVDGAGITNLISMVGTTDLTRNINEYFAQPFWANHSLYLQRSPIMYVNKIATPLLIVHGDADDRVPLGQAQELYSALNQSNKPVKFLIMPGQGHIPSDPAITLETIQTITDWLKQAL